MRKMIIFLSFIFITGCSKKIVPIKKNQPSVDYSYDSTAVTNTPVAEIPAPAKAPVKTAKAAFPKTITVNDAAAKKSVDGRMYYDIQGRRYWKNFKDGKYYLFHKSMYSNPDFKPSNG